MSTLLPGHGLDLSLPPSYASDLAARLDGAGVRLNESARALLAHPAFLAGPSTTRRVRLVERSLADLGLLRGGTLPQLTAAARATDLTPCPPVTAPVLRLLTLDQADSPDSTLRHGRAPTGSVHVLTPSLSADPDLHRGFYLRVVDGTPWLRGFLCHDLHMFGPEDRWVLSTVASPRVTR